MYYVIERIYTVPVSGSGDRDIMDIIEITDEPTQDNNEPCNIGPWSVHTRGEYTTLKRARDAITDILGPVRLVETAWSREGVVETYRSGCHETLSREATQEYMWGDMIIDVCSGTPDEELESLALDYESVAHGEGIILTDMLDIMRKYRNGLFEHGDL